MMRRLLPGAIICLILATPLVNGQALRSSQPAVISRSALNQEIRDFLAREVLAHLDEIKSYNPPPAKIFNAETTGEYTWGNFMYALGGYTRLFEARKAGSHDLAREVGEIGLLEHRLKGTRFSQLYGVLALQAFGRDLKSNAVWQGLDEQDRQRWREFLDVSAFYDPKTQQVINLPENYLGVAARIASITYQLGLLKDRTLVDSVITRAARPFANGGVFSDDAPPTGRFDRYSNEYARFVWEAAETADRKDIMDALRPSLREQMRLWWDLMNADGYGYAWGRSVGLISYADTLEIVGFVAAHPEFRPAPLPQLGAAYYQAWRWLRHDYNDKTHGFSMFDFGRGNFSYITRSREWQQTISILGKIELAQRRFDEALSRENVDTFSGEVIKSDLHHFVFFRRGERPAGVWLVRQGPIHFTLPITSGPRPGVADYLPAPHGLPGFANPVDQVYPSLVPFVELADGRTVVAADCADEIEPGADGNELRVVWRRWAVVGGKPGELADIDLTSDVTWRVANQTLIRDESLMSQKGLSVRHWWLAMPTTAATAETVLTAEERWDRMRFHDGLLAISATADWPLMISLKANGDDPLGRGARGPIPMQLVYETKGLSLLPRRPVQWRLSLRIED